MIKEDNLREIGRFAKPHGIKGVISLLTDFDIEGIAGEPYLVCNIDGIWVPFFIESYRQRNATVALVTFDKIDSLEKVKFLTGKTAFVPSEFLPPAEKQKSSWSSLCGYTIVDEQTGVIGLVTKVDESTPNILFSVDYKGREILVPAALIKRIANEIKEINLLLPDGFLEI
jgi:16S rRNA processing protein RimM